MSEPRVVYCLTNAKNGKRYVGQTKGRVKDRVRFHRSGNGHCRALHSAIRKHGLETFSVSILAEVGSLEEANELERRFIASLGTIAPGGYNLRIGGVERSDFSKASRELMSKKARARGISPACRAAQLISAKKPPSLELIEIRAAGNRGKKRPGHGKLIRKFYADADERKRHSARMKLWWAERKATTCSP